MRKFLLPILLAGSLASSASAGDWRVTPIRIDLGPQAKSGAVTVSNGPAERLELQLSASEWSQDAEGKDRYEETSDLLFFPKMLLIDPSQEKIVRAGIRVPAAAREKAYRLFLTEIPARGESKGASVAIAIRFGVPVFVHPLKEEPRGYITELAADNGVLSFRVSNDGNVHFVVQSILAVGKDAKGAETFRKEVSGWYLLPGVSRAHTVEIPAEGCPGTARIELQLRTDRFPLSGTLEATPKACRP